MSFSKSSSNLALDGTQLKARCKDRDGSYQYSSIDLNKYIVNTEGRLDWRPNGNFIASSRSVKLVGAVLRSECRTSGGDWIHTNIDLDEKIKNFNGKLIYKFEHAIVKVDKSNEKEAIALIEDIYAEHKESASAQAAELEGGSKVLYVNAGVGKDEGLILQVSAEAAASIFHAVGKGSKIETVEVNVLQGKARAWASQAGLGIGISANLIDGKASVFDFTLGVGLDTGVGIEDDSFTFEALGCGFTLGRKVGISVLGSSFGVDFGRCSIL